MESIEKIPDMVMKPKSPKIDQDRMVSPYIDRIDGRVGRPDNARPEI